MPRKTRLKNSFTAALGLFLAFTLPFGCAAPVRWKEGEPREPAAYTRRIMLVLEREDFTPIAGALVRIESEAPARLLEPEGGEGRTDAHGALLLAFEPAPNRDQAARAGGDIIVEYPVKARLIIERAGRPAMEARLSERESFARYADPLYQALNRDPETDLTYYTVTLP